MLQCSWLLCAKHIFNHISFTCFPRTFFVCWIFIVGFLEIKKVEEVVLVWKLVIFSILNSELAVLDWKLVIFSILNSELVVLGWICYFLDFEFWTGRVRLDLLFSRFWTGRVRLETCHFLDFEFWTGRVRLETCHFFDSEQVVIGSICHFLDSELLSINSFIS